MSERGECPGVEQWRRFHAGDGTEEQLETLASAHQESCASCRAVLAALDEPGEGVHYRSTAPPPDVTRADGAVEMPGEGYEVERKLAEGGMGCVWVARDAGVGRQVALKELRPEWEDDERMRERFMAEARVTGQLEHPGIVPVYQMVERPGRPPAYAMRLVRGRTLLEAVREFHAKGGVGSDVVGLRDLLGAFVSVCNTLAYAHSRGVLHRDLKGENVVLGPFGEVVVLDWGIAKVVGAAEAKGSAVKPLPAGLPEATAPGTAAGTVNYMAPEQARGEVELIDLRSDVFGLGGVLYLILTGRAPYVAPDVIDVLIQAQEGRVTPPRRLARQVPRALEAVCLKALAKERADRYQSAAELGDEVKRWLAGEPVAACREPIVARAGRWLRKNRVLASAVAAALLVALGAAGWIGYQEHEREQARLAVARERDREAESLLAEIEGLQEAAKQVQPALAKVQLNYALGRAERAAALLSQGGTDEELRKQVHSVREGLRLAERDQEMAVRLEEARLMAAASIVRGQFDTRKTLEEYRKALGWFLYGKDARLLPIEEIANLLAGSTIKADLAAALDDWSLSVTLDDDKTWAWSLAARLDSDKHRKQIRDAWVRKDRQALERAARSGDLTRHPPATLELLGARLLALGAVTEAERVLRQRQRAYPDAFWINLNLGIVISKLKSAKKMDAVRYFTAAVALRKSSEARMLNLGVALSEQEERQEAEQAFRQAIRLQPDCAMAYSHLGNVLYEQGNVKEAELAYREVIKLQPDNAETYSTLGGTLGDQGRHHEAEEACRQAIKIKPELAEAYSNLAFSLNEQGRHQDAEWACRQAIKIKPEYAEAINNLGNALLGLGDVKEAEQTFRRAIKIKPAYTEAHINLGAALFVQGRHHEAEEACRQAIKIKPADPVAHASLGNALLGRGDFKNAEHAYRQAIKIDPDLVAAHYNLGFALVKQGRFEESVTSFRRTASLYAPGSKSRHNAEQLILHAERQIVLDGKLSEIGVGKRKPASTEELIELASLAQKPFRRRYVVSALLYAEAFQASPPLSLKNRYNAACAAVLAGSGQGNDAGKLDATDRAQLRYAALGWLQDDLSAHTKQLAAPNADAAAKARETLLHWQKDPDLAAVRDHEQLARLPETEQVAWGNLWARIDALLARHKPGK